MASLQGAIKDFSVADILQLLSQQQKTGVLIVENDKKSAEVYFSAGEVVEIKTPADNDAFEAMLVKSGTVTREQLHQALEIQKNSIEHVCSILLRKNMLDQQHFEHIITTHAYEVFYEILQWRGGKYNFVVQKTVQQSPVRLPGLESILLDVLRMIDEWPEIKKVIRSFDMLFDNNYAALEDLDADEERICALVDGRRSVQDIIEAGMLGKFYTCKALVQLLERGAIRLTAGRAESRDTRKNIFPRAAVTFSACAGLAGITALLLLLPGSLSESIFPAAAVLQQHGSALEQSMLRDSIIKYEKALDIFYYKNGRYPESASELSDAGILSTEDIAPLTEKTVEYVRIKGSYELNVR